MMYGIFYKPSYSSHTPSYLLAAGDDNEKMDKVLNNLQKNYGGVHIFKEEIEINALSGRVMKNYDMRSKI